MWESRATVKRDVSKVEERPTGAPPGSTDKHIQDTIAISCTGPRQGPNRLGAARWRRTGESWQTTPYHEPAAWPCYRQSIARRSVEEIISLCTSPEATCGRVGDTRRLSRFRPPSMSFQTRRHPDGHRCLGAYDIQEAVGAWLTFVQRGQTSEDNCTPPLLLKRHYREDRLHRGGQKTRATSCSRKIVTDIRKLF